MRIVKMLVRQGKFKTHTSRPKNEEKKKSVFARARIRALRVYRNYLSYSRTPDSQYNFRIHFRIWSGRRPMSTLKYIYLIRRFRVYYRCIFLQVMQYFGETEGRVKRQKMSKNLQRSGYTLKCLIRDFLSNVFVSPKFWLAKVFDISRTNIVWYLYSFRALFVLYEAELDNNLS